MTQAAGERRFLVGTLLVVGAAVCFGTLGPVSRFAYQAGVTPLGFVTWRSLIGAAVLGGWLLVLRARGQRFADLRRIPRREAAFLVSGGAANGLLNLAMFMAFQRISIALALLTFYTYPAIVGVAGTISGRERMDATRTVALILALSGMTLVVIGQLGSGGVASLDLVGLGLAVAAALFQVVYLVTARGGYPSVPARQATFSIHVVSVACFLVVGAVGGALGSISAPLGMPAAWPDLLVAGIVGAAIPTFLFVAGVRLIGAVRTSILMLLEPVVGASLAALLLGEGLLPIQVVGGAVVLAGAALVQRRTGRVADGGVGPVVAEGDAG